MTITYDGRNKAARAIVEMLRGLRRQGFPKLDKPEWTPSADFPKLDKPEWTPSADFSKLDKPEWTPSADFPKLDKPECVTSGSGDIVT